GIDQAPHHHALFERQRFEQVADLGGRQRMHQAPHRAEAAAVERIRQQAQLARGLVVADGFGHARRLRRSGRAARDDAADQVFMRPLSPAAPRTASPGEDGMRMLRLAWWSSAALGMASGRLKRPTSSPASARSPRGRDSAAAPAPPNAARTGPGHGSRAALPAMWTDAG